MLSKLSDGSVDNPSPEAYTAQGQQRAATPSLWVALRGGGPNWVRKVPGVNLSYRGA